MLCDKKARGRLRCARFFWGVAMALFLISCQRPPSEVAEGIQAPRLDIQDPMTGREVNVKDYDGRVLFVNFWATWCAPCREEVPSIEALQRELFSDGRFAMVTILYKDNPKSAHDYMKGNGYSFPVFTDENGITAERFRVTGVPETYLIDKKGVLRKRVIGSLDWNSTEARTYINTLLLE